MSEEREDWLQPPAAGVERWVALDVGQRRIGVAATDGLGVTVQPVLTLQRRTDQADAKNVARLLHRMGAAGLVVGVPVRLGGERSAQTERVEAFLEVLRGVVEVPVLAADERLSTAEAHERLDAVHGAVRGRKERGRREQARRGQIDQMAAVVILQDFLQHREAVAARERSAAEVEGTGGAEGVEEDGNEGRL